MSKLRRITSYDPIQFAPYDLRIIVYLAAGVAAWLLLSTDYSAIASLIDGPALYSPPINDWLIVRLAKQLLDEPWKILLVQLLGAGMPIAGLIRRNRWIVFIGLFFVVLLECTAFRYRSQLYNLDLPIAILFLLAAFPVSLKELLSSELQCSYESNFMGRVLFAYVGATYLLAGLSKVTFDLQWWNVVDLGSLYAAMMIWHQAFLPDWLDSIAYLLHRLLSISWIGPPSAFLMLLFETLWFTSGIFRWARRTIPLGMFGAHALIFLASGILFSSLAIFCVALNLPWRRLARGCRDLPDTQTVAASALRSPALRITLICASLLLVMVPGLRHWNYFPFSDYNQFGWSYEGAAAPTEIFRLGYLDSETNRVEPVPMNYGGFMDFRWISGSSSWVRKFLTADDEVKRRFALDRIHQFKKALRYHHSNRKLLGPFSMPDHVLAKSKKIEMRDFDTLYVMRGVARFKGRSLEYDWSTIDAMPPLPEN